MSDVGPAELIPVHPLARWSVPARDGSAVDIEAVAGRAVTIVGANGAGKSALATWMVAQVPAGAMKRLIAHRKIWFASSGPEINPAQREQQGQYATTWDRAPDSRYLDHLDGQRASIALFDLLGMINDQNRQAVELYDDGQTVDEVRGTTGERLLPKLNRILANAGLGIVMEVTAMQTFVARNTALGVEYPIFQMSDGEKSALLLAAEILTAPAGKTIAVDEPERHLHRSVSAGLVEAIISERPDCAFVVLTHDLDLAASLASRGPILSLTGCEWSGNSVVSWEIYEISRGESITELARRAILGGRQRVLFIEGDVGSIDLALYGTLFPGWTCSPAGGCNSVIKAVAGVRASADFHWVHAVGIVDGDGRSAEERDALSRRGILALPVNEVESLYYLPAVLDQVAGAQAALIGDSADSLSGRAKSAVLQVLGTHGTLERFARKLAKDEVARKVVDHLPAQIDESDVQISFASPYSRILSDLQAMLASGDYVGLVKAISIRDSAARVRAATAMGFGSVALYERAGRTRIANDHDLRARLLDEIGALPE